MDANFPSFSRVGLCPVLCFNVQVMRGSVADVGRHQDGGDRMDPSPRDHPSKHVLKKGRLSEIDRRLTW